jgi:hypothetical protein
MLDSRGGREAEDTYHARVEQAAGDGLPGDVVDPVVPDLRLGGAADLVAGQGAEPDALSAPKRTSR